MSEGRPWYREPESFIALAALVVSVSAVVVGIYEASLQRAHDRAEVWPHVEAGAFTTPTDATIYLENTGVGPAVINSIVVSVDSQPRQNWEGVMAALLGKAAPEHFSRSTAFDHSLRAGDKVVMVDLPVAGLPPSFWNYIKRVGVTICYASVFGEHWKLDVQLGTTKSEWRAVSACPAQSDSANF
ncbi:MAG: hypothetical protein ACREPM_25365 [Gemmatimonadaceae bacterium]